MENQSVPFYNFRSCSYLTHWERVTHICVSKLTIIGSDNGLSPGRREVIIWTYDGTLLIGHLETNFSEILIEIHTFLFKNVVRKMVVILSRSQCVKHWWLMAHIYASMNRVFFGSATRLPSIRRQAITWNDTDLLSTESMGTNLNLSQYNALNIPSTKCLSFCSGADEFK